MKIRSKLLLLITFFCLPLLFNLFVLSVLVRTVAQSVQSIQEVPVRQQAVMLRMQEGLHHRPFGMVLLFLTTQDKCCIIIMMKR